MQQPFYNFTILDEEKRYDFVSIGNRIIQKTIVLKSTDIPDFYNLILADILPNGEFDVLTVSNNGDRNKILATVAQTLIHFFSITPDAFVFFVGSTPQRTRLYQIAIASELDEVLNRFDLYGLFGNEMEIFQRNKNYDAFVVSSKNRKLV